MDIFYKSLAALLGIPIKALSRRSFPNINQTISSDQLTSDVTVTRDKNGVPHILAQTVEDAVFCQGYVHAQDRLFQMELHRRTARGQLSEVLGKIALDTDRTARTFGFERVGLQDYEQASDFGKKIFQKYIDGINFFLSSNPKLPVEFTLLGFKPAKWELIDSLAFSRFVIWQLSHAWYSKLIRSQIVSKAGPDLAKELEINASYDQAIILPTGIDFNVLDANGILQKVKGPFLGQNMGSNSIAVAGRFTSSGKPLLTNDAHLNVTTPSIWYLCHLAHADNFSAGVSIPGIPMIMIGSNKHFAWTATLSFTDAADLFVEKINMETKTYEYKGEQVPLTVITDEIKVKDKKQPSYTEEILITRNGIVISNVISSEGTVISVKDIALQPTTAIDGFFGLNVGKNWDDFVNGVKKLTAPQLSVSYADHEGNIGYWCTGTVPIRSNGKSFDVPVPGWTGEFDWTGFVPFEEMPHLFNPEKGFIVTANNKVIQDDFPHFLGNVWMNGYRSSVITDYISNAIKNNVKITPDMFNSIMYSTLCLPAVKLAEHIDNLDSTDSDIAKVQMILAKWDKHMDKESIGATLYEVIRFHLVKNILVPTLGDDVVNNFMGLGFDPILLPSHEFYGHDTTVLLRLLDNEQSQWITKAGGKETILIKSIKEALAWLTKKLGPVRDDWQWGKIHTARFPHAFDIQKPLSYVFNPKAIPMDGNTDTPKQSAMMPNLPYDNRAWSVSIRHLFDFGSSDEYFRLIFAPGQSGQVGHEHYDDLIEDWESGKYRLLYLHPDKINMSYEGKMLFQAKK